VNFADWKPAYAALLEDFGFDRTADERARDRLAALVEPFDLARLEAALGGVTVAVAGAGPSLPEETELLRSADAVVAASTAADVVAAAGFDVDLLVTDLDKNPASARAFSRRDTPVAVAAHGDNLPAIEKWVPRCDGRHLLGTTQAAPAGPVVDLGGFTDGDRAAFLADHVGADRLVFPGWDFDDPAVDAVKRRKLSWAARLLHWLERRRDERFAVLDGRRAELELPWLD